MIIYCKRNQQGILTGIARNQSPDFNEAIDDQHPDVIAFRNPPPPTDEQRIDAAFPQTDIAQVLFKVILNQENRIRALESKPSIDATQLKVALKGMLP